MSVVTSKRTLEMEDDIDDPYSSEYASAVSVVKRQSNDFLYAESKRARLEREKVISIYLNIYLPSYQSIYVT